MPSQAILHEAQQLKSVCQRLELVAEQHPPLADALLTSAAQSAAPPTLLEVLVATKLDGHLRPN